MGQQVKHSAYDVAGAYGQEHVPDLTDGRIGQYALNVPLGECGQGRVKGCDCSHPGDNEHSEGGLMNNRKQPHEEVNAGCNHGGGMDQG